MGEGGAGRVVAPALLQQGDDGRIVAHGEGVEAVEVEEGGQGKEDAIRQLVVVGMVGKQGAE